MAHLPCFEKQVIPAVSHMLPYNVLESLARYSTRVLPS